MCVIANKSGASGKKKFHNEKSFKIIVLKYHKYDKFSR